MMDVLEGRITACEYVKWACKRQLDDLHHAHKRGLYFSPDMADIFLDTVRTYKHFKGSFAGQNFEPTPSQVFSFWCIFGWLKEDGTRRFTEVYKEVARKYGKSFEAACVGTYMFEADGEPGAECYTVATKLSQARIIHENVKAIIKKTPEIAEKCKILRDNISIPSTFGKFEPLGRDSQTEDGLNPHFASIDEYHAHKSDGMYQVIDSAFGARSQPLMYVITTAGTNPAGPCYAHREYCIKVLDPNIDVTNDNLFCIIYTLDEKDDPFDEGVWEKANPNIEYIPTTINKLRSMAEKAKEKPTDLVNFKTKHLNIWCNSSSPWLDMQDWYACNGTFDYRDLINKPCYSALDLASVNDLAALVHVFPPEQESIASQRERYRKDVVAEMRANQPDIDDRRWPFYLEDKADDIDIALDKLDYIIPDPYRVIPHAFVPTNNIRERSKAHGVNYNIWMDDPECNFHATPSLVTDYTFIEHQIEKDNARFDIKELAYDPYNAAQLILSLTNKGFNCVEMPQTWGVMSPPTKYLEMLVILGLIEHNNNPVMNWNAQNVVVHTGPSGNYKPDKNKSSEKIDLMVALIMALDRAVKNEAVEEFITAGFIGI
jgi:phage terminase large subunit-like protein